MRLAGKTCALCRASLPPPHIPGEKLCMRCEAERTKLRRVYMHFMLRDGWYCQFLEEDLKTSLPRKFTFADVSKVRELAEKGKAFANLEARHAFNQGVEVGRGGIFLNLTEEQYAKLKKG